MRREDGKVGRVMRFQGGKGGRMVRWEGERFLVLFNGGEHRVSPRLFLMLIKGTKGQSDINQGNKGDGLKSFLCAHRDGKTLLRSSASC